MKRHESETREAIVAAAIQLIADHRGDAAKVTVRDISAKAGVGIGLVNYHFQSKEKLIEYCVQLIIGRIIEGFPPLYASLEMQPLEKLRYLLKATASYLADNPGMSRLSVSHDIVAASVGDNTEQTTKVYYPVVREVCGNDVAAQEVYMMLHMMISAIQVAFLRCDELKALSGFDYFDKTQRNKFVDRVIDGAIMSHVTIDS